jgi:hypothetical protein
MLQNRREVGTITGKAPFGYKISRRPDGRKFLEPTAEGLTIIPGLFRAAADGRAMRSMAAQLGMASCMFR